VLSLIIREALAANEPFLLEMLYQSLYLPEGRPPFDRTILLQPELAQYVKNWGRSGDLGFVAEDSLSKEAVGAAWVRMHTAFWKGYGYVSDDIPELAIAVLAGHRGSGIGTTLLQRVFESACSSGYRAISLSVSIDNPAKRLYERLGFRPVETCRSSVTMLKHLG